jgi:hypothetical protein
MRVFWYVKGMKSVQDKKEFPSVIFLIFAKNLNRSCKTFLEKTPVAGTYRSFTILQRQGSG